MAHIESPRGSFCFFLTLSIHFVFSSSCSPPDISEHSVFPHEYLSDDSLFDFLSMTCETSTRLWAFSYDFALILGQHFSFERILLYKCIKIAEGILPTLTWWRQRAVSSRKQDYLGISIDFLPPKIAVELKPSGPSTHLYLVSKDWTCQVDKLYWVNLIKGKNLETRMGSRNRNSVYNQWLLFFVRGKIMTVLVVKLKAFIFGEVIQVVSW